MEEGLLSLKWNNHQSTLVHLLRVLRKQCYHSDAVVVCGSRFFGVHRLVLMACSDYFCDIFSQVQDCPKPVIVLQDIDTQDLEALLDYMYLGEVDVHQNKLPSLIKAAENLHIKGLATNDDDPTKPLKTLHKLTPSSRLKDSTGSSTNTKLDYTNSSTPKMKTYHSDVDERGDELSSRKYRKRLRNSDSNSNSVYASEYDNGEEKLLDSTGTNGKYTLNEDPSPLCSDGMNVTGGSLDSNVDFDTSVHIDEECSVKIEEGQDSVERHLATSVAAVGVKAEVLPHSGGGSVCPDGGGLVMGDTGQVMQQYMHASQQEQQQHQQQFFQDPTQVECLSSPHYLETPSAGGVGGLNTASMVDVCRSATPDLRCPQCLRQFTDKYKRDRHMLIHSGIKPFGCPFCPYRSNRKDPVMRHLKYKHAEELRLGSTVEDQHPEEVQQPEQTGSIFDNFT